MRKVFLFILLITALILPAFGEQSFDHQLLTEILRKSVKNGKVDYELIDKKYSKDLDRYVDSLRTAKPSEYGRTGEIAFWLNAYNALAIKSVVDGGSPSSAFSRGDFFRRTRYFVAGQERSLDDIEHKALRPLAKDPRVHFVLVCGADSCPQLKASAFLGATDLEASLEQATQNFLSDPKNLVIDVPNRRLKLSKLFDWYAEDFGNVPAFISKYRPEPEKSALMSGQWDLDFFDYDWSSNQAK